MLHQQYGHHFFFLNILCTPIKTHILLRTSSENKVFICSENHEKQTSRATEGVASCTSCGCIETKGNEIEEGERVPQEEATCF